MHLVVGDSRIAGIGDLIKEKGGAVELIEFKMCKGANLERLAEEAVGHLSKCPFDVIYIAGGACDITSKDHTSGKIYFNWKDQLSLQNHLVNSLNRANDKFKKYFPATRIIFCPLIGSELSRIIHCQKITEEQQIIVNNAVWEFNSQSFKINEERSVFAPALHHTVHRFCKGTRHDYYHHLEDGLHLSKILKNNWAKQFIKAVARN